MSGGEFYCIHLFFKRLPKFIHIGISLDVRIISFHKVLEKYNGQKSQSRVLCDFFKISTFIITTQDT